MRLFEGGILDKITNDEYEKMFKSMKSDKQATLNGGNGKESSKAEGKTKRYGKWYLYQIALLKVLQ